MANDYARTIEDLELLYYTDKGISLLAGDDVNSPILDVNKDAPVISTTTGVYNAVYGAQAWVQLNQEANSFGVLPKSVHRRSGWRVISVRSTTLPYGGVAETAAIPATTKPTFAEVSTKPKLIAAPFENSEIQEFIGHSDDDAYGQMEQLRSYMAVEHKEDMNVQLNTQNGTLASNNLESIDRVVGSYSEINASQENDESTAYTANELDIYSLDRDAGASYADAYVGHNSTSGVRSLTDALLQALIQNTLQNGANADGQFIQTGYDTLSVINQLYDAQVRYNILGNAWVKPGVNGIESAGQGGVGVGINVVKYQHAVVIKSKNTVVDTGGVSRIYLLDASNPEGFDLPRLSIRVAKPTQYFEAGTNQGNPWVVNKFGTKGLFRTMAEIICPFFKAQGKLRDLKA